MWVDRSGSKVSKKAHFSAPLPWLCVACVVFFMPPWHTILCYSPNPHAYSNSFFVTMTVVIYKIAIRSQHHAVNVQSFGAISSKPHGLHCCINFKS